MRQKYIKKCMKKTPFEAFFVPIIAEASAGFRFGEMEELEVTSYE